MTTINSFRDCDFICLSLHPVKKVTENSFKVRCKLQLVFILL